MTSKPITPFTFVDAVGFSKKDLLKEGASEKQYVSFLINKAFSYHKDSVFYADEMNVNGHLPVVMQHAFYLNILPAKRRFAKWAKGTDRDTVKAVAQYFGYNEQKAEEVMSILSVDQIEQIRKTVEDHEGQVRQLSRGYT